jgi:hypothetical protein
MLIHGVNLLRNAMYYDSSVYQKVALNPSSILWITYLRLFGAFSVAITSLSRKACGIWM